MQAQLYFYDDRTAEDYSSGTSFNVVDLIYSNNREFFDWLGTSGEPNRSALMQTIGAENGVMTPEQSKAAELVKKGLRACRIARAGDGKLTEGDIRAWDRLVLHHIIPWNERQIVAVEKECEKENGNKEIYKLLAENLRTKVDWINRTHADFMMSFETVLSTFNDPIRRFR